MRLPTLETIQTVTDVDEAKTVLHTHTGITITPKTPMIVTSDRKGREILRHTIGDMTVDIAPPHHRAGIYVAWSTTTPQPWDAHNNRHNPEYNTATTQYSVMFIHPNITQIDRYLNSHAHGQWEEHLRGNRKKFSHYLNGLEHNPRGLAVEYFRDNEPSPGWDSMEYYAIHGQKANNTKPIRNAIETQDPKLLARMVRYKNKFVAYFAAHNPACPETAKAEYMLARGHEFTPRKQP